MNSRHIAMLILTGTLLVGCDNSSKDNLPVRKPTAISGIGFDGLCIGCDVKVYDFAKFISDQKDTLVELGTGVTDSKGLYSLSITGDGGPVILVIKQGHYVEEATGKTIELKAADVLYAVTNIEDGVPLNVSITYYTHLATGLAIYMVKSGATVLDATNQANKRISDFIGVDITKITPKEITNVANATPFSTPEHIYGFATAANSFDTVFISQQNNENPLQFIYNSMFKAQQAFSDISYDGILNGQGEIGSLYYGIIPITVDNYRYDIAKNIFVAAASSRNATALKFVNVKVLAELINNSTDTIFGDAPIKPFSDNAPIIANVSVTDNAITKENLAINADVNDVFGIFSMRVLVNDIEVKLFSGNEKLTMLLDTTAYADGNHTVSIEATNYYEGTTRVDIPIIIANDASVIANIQPAEAAYVRGLLMAHADASDPIGLQFVDFYFDDNYLGRAPNTLAPEISIDSTKYVDGTHSFKVTAANSIGTEISKTTHFFIDNTLPVLVDTAPATNSNLEGVFTARMTASDSNLSNVELLLDGVSLIKSVENNVGGAISTQIDVDSSTVIDGPHNLAFQATDFASNIKSDVITLDIDNTAPTITGVAPVAEYIVQQPGLMNFSANVSDTYLSDVKILLDGAFYSQANPLTKPEFVLDTKKVIIAGVEAPLTEGRHSIEIDAVDTIGHRSIANTSFIVDNTLPISTFSPAIYAGSTTVYNKCAATGVCTCTHNFSSTDVNSGVVVAVEGGQEIARIDLPGVTLNWSYTSLRPDVINIPSCNYLFGTQTITTYFVSPGVFTISDRAGNVQRLGVGWCSDGVNNLCAIVGAP